MPKRQSGEMLPAASARSRSTIASRSAISCRLVSCRRSQPLLAQSSKLILAPDDEQLRPLQHRCNEMVTLSRPPHELLRRQDVRVDLPAELHLKSRQYLAKSAQPYSPDHHQVDIA